jgi:holo-[acyl-carrier protein] synthase
MIYGIGVDRVLVSRIELAAVRWGERFARRVLGPGELRVYHQQVRRHSRLGVAYLARRFAAKEAFAKAMGIGLRAPMLMPHLDVLNDACGKPLAIAHGDLDQWLQAHNLQPHISLSDESDAALAFVLLARKGPADSSTAARIDPQGCSR